MPPGRVEGTAIRQSSMVLILLFGPSLFAGQFVDGLPDAGDGAGQGGAVFGQGFVGHHGPGHVRMVGQMAEQDMAFTGHTVAQPPQPWHMAAKTRGVSPRMVMAPNWHMARHPPQRRHTFPSMTGISRLAVMAPVMPGHKNRCRFCSSTSRSTAKTGRSWASVHTEARTADRLMPFRAVRPDARRGRPGRRGGSSWQGVVPGRKIRPEPVSPIRALAFSGEGPWWSAGIRGRHGPFRGEPSRRAVLTGHRVSIISE